MLLKKIYERVRDLLDWNHGSFADQDLVKWDAGTGKYKSAGPAATGTVTHTGALTADQPMFGNGAADSKVGTKTGTGNQAVMSQSPTIVTPTIASFANSTHSHVNAAGGGTLSEAALATTDITTNDVTIAKHGFAPKAPNDATKYLDGTGAWSVPAGGGGYTDEQAQDAVGGILLDTATINLTYDDATPTISADVIDGSITYAKMQATAAGSKLLGRGDAGAGAVEEITLGAGLTMTGSTLSAAGGGGTQYLLQPVRVVATTSEPLLFVLPPIIDGVQTVAGDTVLLTAEGTGPWDATDNGIYDIGALTMTRRADFDVGASVAGLAVIVQEGTVNADTLWECTSDAGADVVDTDTLEFAQIGGGGSSLTLQTNSTPNGDQTLLNLVAGTNITLTDNGTGSVTIDASGGVLTPPVTIIYDTASNEAHVALNVNESNSVATTFTQIAGQFEAASVHGSGTVATVIAIAARSQAGPEHITTTIYGVRSEAAATNGATVTNSYGVHANANNDTGTTTNAHGLFATVIQDSSGGTVTNAYGVYSVVASIANGSTITNAFGVYITQGSRAGTVTNDWGYYQENANLKNRFDGPLGIGGTNNACAALDVASTTRGFLPPRMTTTQRDAIGSPVDGLIIYDTTLDLLCCYQNGAWVANSAGGSGDALVANPLSQFSATTSLQLKDTISDETGSGALVFATSPTLVTPALGTPASGVATNLTGTAAGLTAGTVTTNANLTGPITSTGNATAIASQTGTGTTFVVSVSPALTGTPTAPTAAAATDTTQIATTAFVTAAVGTAVTGLLELKGSTDCSTNPNYPAASKGDLYLVTVAGKIGGASGKSVDVGDSYIASEDNAGGTEASVGTSWFVLEHNLAGALLSANNLSDVASASTSRTNLGLGTLATQSGTFSGTSSGTNTGDQTITLTSDVTGSGTGSFAATIANDAVTYAKIQNVSATDKLLGRSTAGAGDVEEITCTAAGRALIDDAAASNQRTTLGLGTAAVEAAASFAILVGQSGGQTLIGGTASGNSLTLQATSHATKGSVIVSDKLRIDSQVYFNSEIDNGNSGTADTIDWTAGNKQKTTATGNCTYTFTAPSGPASLVLKFVNDGTARTITWPATVLWSGGTKPTHTGTNGKVDLIALYWDGTSYFATFSLNH